MTKMNPLTFNITRTTVTAMTEMRQALTKGGAYGYGSGDRFREKREPVIRAAEPVTYFSVIDEDGKIIHNGNQACHAGLSYSGASKPQRVISRIQWESSGRFGDLDWTPHEMKVAFFDWLTLESPYAPTYIYGGGEKAVRRGFVVCRTDVPSNLLAGALIAHRAATEFNSRIMRGWWELVKRGVNKNLAFFLGHWFADGAGGLMDVTYRNSHVAVDASSYSTKYIMAFCTSKMFNLNKNYLDDPSRYHPVHDIFYHDGGGDSRELKNIEKDSYGEAKAFSKKSRKSSVNPFKKQEAADVVDSQIFYDIFAPRIIEFFKDLNHG
jgi:hypothetical protein